MPDQEAKSLKRADMILKSPWKLNLKKKVGTLLTMYVSCESNCFWFIWKSFTGERQLHVDISKLQQYRQAGITHLGAIDIYERLLARREENKPRRQLLSDLLNHMQVLARSCFWIDQMTQFWVVL